MKFLWFAPFLVSLAGAEAQELEYGEAEFFLSCAECHGSYGRGDGTLAQRLGIEASDLTALQAQNDGEFPYWRVYSFIDGRHSRGDRPMPNFGTIFGERDLEQYGEEVGEALTERRIHALTEYIRTLQQ